MEIELEEIIKEILAHFEQEQPVRLVLDSLSEIRLLAEGSLHYRRELYKLNYLNSNRICTALFIDVQGEDRESMVAETLANGFILLENLSSAYGGARRRLQIRKLRASKSAGGYHDFLIGDRGVETFPCLEAAAYRQSHTCETLESGIPAFYALLGGGLIPVRVRY